MSIEIRKQQLVVQEIFHEGGPLAIQPRLTGSIVLLMKNPFSGQYVEDIQWFIEELKAPGLDAAKQLLAALGDDASKIDGYGKGSITGEGGEVEHGALWHAPGGYAMRQLLGNAKAIVPSTKKVGGPGCRIDIPITHVNASYVRSHFDSLEVGVADGPQYDEIAYILAMTCGPRIHARSGGLQVSEISVGDGQR